HRAGVAADQDGAALLVHAAACSHAALHHDVAAAERRAGQRAGVLLDDHDAGHHVLAHRPAHAALDHDLGPVDDAKPEVPQAALEPNAAPGQDADAQRVLRAGVLHRDVADAALVQQPAQLQVDLPCGQAGRVERRLLAHDVRDLRGPGVGLGQAARVVGDPAFAGGHSVHTSTSLSYG